MKRLKIVIVMPAYNAASTLEQTLDEIPKGFGDNLILVDDASTDDTIKIAKKLGVRTIPHKKNLGYGANQKTCYKQALKLNPDVVVMLHPDYQYDASLLPDLVKPILEKRYDFMFGSRISSRKSALEGGMPKLKYYVNRLFCFLENIVLGVNFTEHFSGFRAYSKKLLVTVPYKKFSNDFVFDQQMAISALSYGFKINEISIPTRYHNKSSSINFTKGFRFLIETVMCLVQFKLHQWNLMKSSIFS